MKNDVLTEKIFSIHQADGGLSWRALAYYRFEPGLEDVSEYQLYNIRAGLIRDGWIQFADEKMDMTILTAAGRERIFKQQPFLKRILIHIRGRRIHLLTTDQLKMV